MFILKTLSSLAMFFYAFLVSALMEDYATFVTPTVTSTIAATPAPTSGGPVAGGDGEDEPETEPTPTPAPSPSPTTAPTATRGMQSFFLERAAVN